MKLRLNSKQINRLSEILANLGLVFVAALILPRFTDTSFNSIVFIVGMFISLTCFIMSLILLKRK